MANETIIIAGTGNNCTECTPLNKCVSCSPVQSLPALEPCDNGTPCLDTTYTDCVTYNGANITCEGSTLVTTGANLTSVLQSLYAQICAGGFVGSKGDQGDPGPTPVISVTETVEIATPLLPPIVTSVETAPGEYNLTFRLPAGENGISPNVVPFNVNNLTPGSSATVTLDPSSTPSLKRFNFGIPRGYDGPQGEQGVSIVSGTIDVSGHLILSLSDSSTFDAGYVVGPAGNNGLDGDQGAPGSNALLYEIGNDDTGNTALNTLVSTGVTSITLSKTSRVGYTGSLHPTNNAAGWLTSVKIGDRIQLYKSDDASVFGIYTVLTKGVNGLNTSVVLTVDLVSANGTFILGDTVAAAFTLKGDTGSPGVNGTDGAKGAVGPNTLVYKYNSSATTIPGQVYTNNGNTALISSIKLNTTSMSGYSGSTASVNNATAWLDGITIGTRVQLTNINDSTIYGIYKVLTISSLGSEYTLSVLKIASSGILTVNTEFAINYATQGADGNYVLATNIPSGVDVTCPYGGALIETRSGEDDSIVGAPVKVCNPKDGNYVEVTNEAPGVNCTYGGLKVQVLDGETTLVLTTHYVCSGPSSVGISSNCEFTITDNTAGSNVSFEVNANDSGWVDLLGFSHQNLMGAKPQARRIGKVIHFRGQVVVPLADPTTGDSTAVIPSSGAYTGKSYADIAYVKTFTGTGGVTANVNGGLFFNNNTSCLPPSLFCNGVEEFAVKNVFGGTVIAERPTLTSYGAGATIDAVTKIISGTAGSNVRYGASLSSVFKILIIEDSNVFYIGTIQDIEQPTGTYGGLTYSGGSTLRSIISNVRYDEFIPDMNSASTNYHSMIASSATEPLTVDTTSLGKWLVTCDAGNYSQLGGFSFTIDHMKMILE